VTLPAAMTGFLFQVPEPAQLAASLLLSLVPPFIIAFFVQRHIAEMHLA
jgi:ABC-type glycerol-3-phosphate transport system permease component